MSADTFDHIAAGIASIALALAVLGFLLILTLRYRDERRERRERKTVGAPPLHGEET